MPDNLEALFRERLRSLRIALGWSQADLAAETGYQQQSIAKLESGAQRIRLDDAQTFADALGVPLLDLIAPELHDSERLLKSTRVSLEATKLQLAELDADIAERRVDLERLERLRDDAVRDVARYQIRIQELERAVRRGRDPKRRGRN